MADTRTQKLAQFYEQCLEKGYSNMDDEVQSLKAKVIAADLGLDYGRISKLYKEAGKAYEAVRAEEEERVRRATKEAVAGELLISFFEVNRIRPTEETGNRICVYLRPDGSIYSTCNDGPKIEGAPFVELFKGGYTAYDMTPVQTSFVGTTVGNSTFVSGMDTGGDLKEKRVKSDKGYIKASAGDLSFEVGLIIASAYTCEAFKRDPDFQQLNGKRIVFWNYQGRAEAERLRSGAQLSATYGTLAASAVGFSYLNQAEDELRLPYEKCDKILSLLSRIIRAQFPPTDEELYQLACAQAEGESFSEVKEAFDNLTLISDYKDAAQRAEELRPRYEALLQEEKEKNVLLHEQKKKTGRIVLAVCAAAVCMIAATLLLSSAAQKKQLKKQYAQIIAAANVGDTVLFGTYEQDGVSYNGKEAIEWIILKKEAGRVMLVSKNLLAWRYYDDYKGYSKDVVTWEKSGIRKWLNESFYQDAFSRTERSIIQLTAITAESSANDVVKSDPGNPTEDKVFLLSIHEAMQIYREPCYTTKYAAQDTNKGFGGAWWWLRSPGEGRAAAVVRNEGTFLKPAYQIYYEGYDYTYQKWGVRPALWLLLE